MLEHQISINNSPKVCVKQSPKERKSANFFFTSFAMPFFHACDVKFVRMTIGPSAPSVWIAFGNNTSNTLAIYLLGSFTDLQYFNT